MPQPTKWKIKNISRISVLIAFAMILSYVEAIIPLSIAIPGIKLGLANIITLWLLYIADFKTACFVSILRIFLIGLLFGSLYSFLFSISGGLLSLIFMYFFKKLDFSVYGVSIIGGTMHNVGQLLIASFLFDTHVFIYYLPFLIISGIITGMFIAIVTHLLIKRIGFLW